MRYELLNPKGFNDGEGHLPLDQARVKELERSITRVGIINPITVQPRAGGMVYVIAGRHRLAAIRNLGWTEVPCIVLDPSDDPTAPTRNAEIAMIDENLIRGELSDDDRQKLTARRKQLYEDENPETSHGTAGAVAVNTKKGRSRQNGDCGKAERFSKEFSKATGRSERSVQRDAARGKVLLAVQGTSLDTPEEVAALLRRRKRTRNTLIRRARRGERVSAVILSSLPKPEALQNGSADPSQQRTPPDAPSPYLDALATLRRIKGIDVSVVDTVPPRDRMAFKAAVHEASLRLDELKEALPQSGAA